MFTLCDDDDNRVTLNKVVGYQFQYEIHRLNPDPFSSLRAVSLPGFLHIFIYIRGKLHGNPILIQAVYIP